MSLADLTDPSAVQLAIEEYDRVGREAFLSKYRFGKAHTYFLVVDGQQLDSKAIAGVAYGYQFPEEGPLLNDQFNAGTPVKAKLEELGFIVRVVGDEEGGRNAARKAVATRKAAGNPPTELTDPAAVEKAIQEFDELGRDVFLAKYGFGKAQKFYIDLEGRQYDAKAIVGAARGYQYPEQGPLLSRDFPSNEQSVRGTLERLGFHVLEKDRDDGQERIRWTGMGRPGAPLVEKMARKILDAGWLGDDSVLIPGTPVWTAKNLAELHRSFVEQPGPSTGTFLSKLQKMLEGASEEAIQLMAELILLNVIPLSSVGGEAKRRLIETVLGWAKAPISIPSELSEVLNHGVWNGGPGFNVGKPEQLEYLIRTLGRWKALTSERRVELLDDAWGFRDFIMSEVKQPNVPSQRSALLYLFFPGHFEPIGPLAHKKRIRDAFLDYCPRPSGNVDRDLLAIHVALEQEHQGPIDFYRSPWAQRWQGSKRAWLVRGASVGGRNLVPAWIEEGFCSLAATHLPPVEPGTGRDELERIVEESYAAASYNARAGKVREFFAFLSRMKAGDVVVATSEDKVYLGLVTGEAVYEESPSSRSNLRREVQWCKGNRPIQVANLPAPLPARLSVQHDVVELTEQLEILERLIKDGGSPPKPPEPVLPDATEELAHALLVELAWLQESVELLSDRHQLIYYGPPGTGKTYIAQELARHLAGRENTKLVQFHPAYSYEDFFEGYRPQESVEGSGSIGFKLTPGPLRRLVDQAREHPEEVHVLIVDEINRANLAKVFGELYFLLEYRDEAIDLLYSSEEAFTLPKNVYLIGTMNTADRSIALVDSAMRRRFAFVSLHPSDEPVLGLLRRWLQREQLPNESALLLEELNRRIEDADFKIGPSYLMRGSIHSTSEGLDRVWRTSIMPLLEEHHYGQSTDLEQRYGLIALRKVLASTVEAEEARPIET